MRGVGGRANGNREKRPGILRVRGIKHRLRRLAQFVLMNVSYDSDNLEPLVRTVNLKAFADGVFAGPINAGHRAVDDRHAGHVRAIRLVEITALQKRNVESVEIAGSDYAVVGAFLLRGESGG